MQITTFLILAFATPKEVKEEPPTRGIHHQAARRSLIRRSSSFIYDTFTKGIKSSLGLHARIYIGLTLEGKLL